MSPRSFILNEPPKGKPPKQTVTDPKNVQTIEAEILKAMCEKARK